MLLVRIKYVHYINVYFTHWWQNLYLSGFRNPLITDRQYQWTPKFFFGWLPEPFGGLWMSARKVGQIITNGYGCAMCESLAINFRFPVTTDPIIQSFIRLGIFTSSKDLYYYSIRWDAVRAVDSAKPFDHCPNPDCIWWRISFEIQFNRLGFSVPRVAVRAAIGSLPLLRLRSPQFDAKMMTRHLYRLTVINLLLHNINGIWRRNVSSVIRNKDWISCWLLH